MSNAGRLQLVPQGPAARDALWAAVDNAREDGALTPVTVVVPSTTTGLSLRPALARRGRGFANVHFLPLARVAELVGAPGLVATGRAPLTPALRAEAVRAALSEVTGPLARAADHPATVRLASATFADLRAAPDTDRALPAGAAAEPVLRSFATFQSATARFYDEATLARAATAALPSGATPARAELGAVVLFLPRSLNDAEQELVVALARTGDLTAILGLTGDPDADAATRLLADRLAPSLGPPAAADATVPTGGQVVIASDGDDEIREVVRLALTRADDGVPLHRMAILYRLADPYARTVAQALAAASIPAAGPTPRRLADTVAGRVLLALLELADHDLARDAVAAWLASGPVRDPARGRPVDAYRWDLLSREAGVVAGADQWDERLARLGAARTAARDELAVTGDDEAMHARMASDVEELAALRTFVATLADDLAPAQPSWPGFARWARRCLDRYLGPEAARGSWPDRELDAARRVDAALEGIASLDALGTTPDAAAFRAVITAELDAPAGRLGRMGDGIFVGPLAAAFGADFDVVFVVGMAEGIFPPRGREDPLLRDAVRAQLGLPLYAARRSDERRDYLAALACAPERILSVPRADPRAQRKRLPSRWLLETAAALDTRRTAEELLALPAASWLRVVPSFERGVLDASEPASIIERDVASLRGWAAAHRSLPTHPLVTADAQLAAGCAALAGRASTHVTAFDGAVGEWPALVPNPDRPVSATALETWATCPFKYLLAQILRVREVPRPEELDTISPLDRGSLVHAVLEEFLRTAPPRTSPPQPWSASDYRQLLEIAARQCDRVEAAGLTGHPRRWTLERRRIRRELLEVLDQDVALRTEHDVVPMPDGLERAFGLDGGDPPVEVEVDGRRVAFRGRIDRIDRSPDGAHAVVWDYKTGRSEQRIGDDPLAAGTRLQLPIYAAVAARATGARDVAAHYWYTQSGNTPGFAVDDSVRARFAEVVGGVLDGIEAGAFPAVPGDPRQDGAGRDTWDNCCYCPYDRVCAPDRDRLHARKAADPAHELHEALTVDEERSR
jgi:ATP-dependent helicase/nuclease subunit B